MDPLWIAVAFVLGFLARQVGLPPLIGFLAAGFVLKAFGVEAGEALDDIADMGVHLLLFTIGLKLRVRNLLRPEIWAGTTLHMAITIGFFWAGMALLGSAGLALFGGLDTRALLVVAFALSFSSTVFAVKVLEEKGEMASLHGRTAVGILIMQDIIAVVFLTLSSGSFPSVWALALLALLLVRPLLMRIMDRSGHGELLVLLGLVLTMAGTGSFSLVGLKPDLGALFFGVLVGSHPKASELAKALFGFKELFLVGFFLTIGLAGIPSLPHVGVAALLAAVVIVKVVLYFALLARFRLRARTSLLSSLSLANYSEFGLIVGAVGVASGWISADWLVIIAIALSITFVIAAPLNTSAQAIYGRLAPRIRPFEAQKHHPEEEPISTGDATIAIFGMGRVGIGAFDFMRKRYAEKVIGVDFDPETVEEQRAAGRNVILGDPTDPHFWERARGGKEESAIRLVMLTMPSVKENAIVARGLASFGFPGIVASTARFDDEIEELKSAGVHATFNFYEEAGDGFAQHVHEQFGDSLKA
jgi:predicted Kef-type K+ transport protein